MNPSPPKRPAPNFFVNAIDRSTFPTAQRNALRSARTVFPRSSIGKILPAIGFASAIFPCAALQLKTLMNIDSPARNLRISPLTIPPCIFACSSMPAPM